MVHQLKLWYKEPASEWTESLPLGNGRLGAMVAGHVYHERMTLNEDTLWTGLPLDKPKNEAIDDLEEARQLILIEKYYEAQELMNDKLLSGHTQSYAPMADLNLNFHHDGMYHGYKRELDLEEAKVTISYKINEVEYQREIFISEPDDAMVIKLSTNQEKSITFTASLKSLLHFKIMNITQDTIALKGITPINAVPGYVDQEEPLIYDLGSQLGMRFQISLKAILTEGELQVSNGIMKVKSATQVTLILVAHTSFNGFDKGPGIEGKDEALLCHSQLEQLENKSYDEMLQIHINDYQQLFNRVEFSLGPDRFKHLPTNERLDRLKKGKEDLALICLYFQYGRYLLISSSRKGSQPANLQGIWNEDLRPAWSSNYTVNINTEMNYWPAEVCHLPECHEPLFSMIKELSQTGSVTAKSMFNCRGWLTNHNVDLWRYSSTVAGSSEWGFWPMGGVWLCQHLWEHYDFTRDKEFLKSEAYPLMKGAAQFLLDYLIEDLSGNLVTCPSTSPENNFLNQEGRKCCVSMMTTMDLALIRDLFNNCIEAIEILEEEATFKEILLKTLKALPPYKINKFGGIQEWFKDFDEYEPGHRHMSHLFGLYPGKEITEETHPDLVDACQKTLQRRLSEGGGHTGWSCAWIINFYARLKESELANQYLHVLLTRLTFMNLFCVHPPFQIDGNFGGTAGIAEMLIQSHKGVIEILPAIPSHWKSGRVKGLKARGGFILSFQWEDYQITECMVESTVGGRCRINWSKNTEVGSVKQIIELETVAGKTYQLT